jgi:ABC-type transporter Mla subunit MlaD
MSDIATNIAKSIIESMLLTNIFTDEMEKEAAEKLASGDTEAAIATVEKAMEAAKELTPNIQALLESLHPYFQAEEDESATLGSGIKGITEDTANLLASYLNAIRADVSYSKTIWERMDKTTQQIASLLTSVPNLMEYQAQIAANTFDTATATQEILSELRGVITSDGGYTGVRTIG